MSSKSKEMQTNANFNIAVNMIAKGKYSDFLKDIKREMGWKHKMFYRKINGDSPLSPPENIVAKKVLAEYGVDIDTLKYTK